MTAFIPALYRFSSQCPMRGKQAITHDKPHPITKLFDQIMLTG
jgi:hypothetical protein